MFIIQHNGQTYDLPWDYPRPDRPRPDHLPNEIMLTMDERDFASNLEPVAEWVSGCGPYLLLAFCKSQLTVTRWSALADAIKSKHDIDGTGCGGLCCQVHVIAYADPTNPHQSARHEAIGQYILDHDVKPMMGAAEA